MSSSLFRPLWTCLFFSNRLHDFKCPVVGFWWKFLEKVSFTELYMTLVPFAKHLCPKTTHNVNEIKCNKLTWVAQSLCRTSSASSSSIPAPAVQYKRFITAKREFLLNEPYHKHKQHAAVNTALLFRVRPSVKIKPHAYFLNIDIIDINLWLSILILGCC